MRGVHASVCPAVVVDESELVAVVAFRYFRNTPKARFPIVVQQIDVKERIRSTGGMITDSGKKRLRT
jgi:hypothetical protein